ncbi:MAG: hypothetical protein CMJ33_08950 [Phycisphaerae bacterium]|nr:hypothetical protein [Phycisphaerae bacterium]
MALSGGRGLRVPSQVPRNPEGRGLDHREREASAIAVPNVRSGPDVCEGQETVHVLSTEDTGNSR